MSEKGKIGARASEVADWTRDVAYGDWSFESRVVSLLGASGAALQARWLGAHERVRAALGADGFALLDAYVSAATALACAREEAAAEVGYALGMAARAAGEAPSGSRA